jgi:chromosome partitioning protein
MKIVIAQHKGGVGKTTLAVHVAGVLADNGLDKILLMDCDSQSDSFRFFTKQIPSKSMEIKEGMDGVDVLWNYKREKLSNKNRFSEYDHIVVDIDTKVQNALQVITEIEPDIILIPIDKQYLSVEHLPEVLSLIAIKEGIINYPSEVKIVQMGSTHNLSNILSSLRNKPKYLNPNFSIPNLEIEFNNSLRDGRYVWGYSLDIDIKNIFKGVVYNG